LACGMKLQGGRKVRMAWCDLVSKHGSIVPMLEGIDVRLW
jgi:hypothetical protein